MFELHKCIHSMENKIEFTKGETVRLNSGGPLMTISNVLSNNQLECIWFNDEEDICIHSFDAELVFPDNDEEWIEVGDDEAEEWEEEEIREEVEA
jgi:uncharacterized protein YodC (DUF2158 family)